MSLPQHYSYDIFDTCISRLFANPKDLFLALGLRIAPATYNKKKRRRFALAFMKRRIFAEKLSYLQNHPHRSSTIFEIYENLLPMRGLHLSISELINLELEMESECIYPIPEVVSEIMLRQALGQRVIFISDMYLCTSHINDIFCKIGINPSLSSIYVSSDIKATKHSSELFKHVLQNERLHPKQLIHKGDNFWSDYQVAKNLGINTLYFSKTQLNPHEIFLTKLGKKGDIDSSISAALSRKLRLTAPPSLQALPESVDNLIIGTIAPLLVSFVKWILVNAKNSGISRLYFVARDGEVLYKIAKRISDNDRFFDIRYLYGSRKAWLIPTADIKSDVFLQMVKKLGIYNNLDEIFDLLGIFGNSRSSVCFLLGIDSTKNHCSLINEYKKLSLQDLLNNTQAVSLVNSILSESNHRVVHYFRQEGLFDDCPWALVDVGWSLNCQKAVNRVIGGELGRNWRSTGYYFGTSANKSDIDEAGQVHCFIQRSASFLPRRRVIVEHCFTPSTHTTTIGYAPNRFGALDPAFGVETRGQIELAYAQRLHSICLHTADMASCDPQVNDSLSHISKTLITNAESWLRSPTPQQSDFFSIFSTVSEISNETRFVRRLAGPISTNDVFNIFNNSMGISLQSSSRCPIWLEGSVKLSSWHIRVILRVFLLTDQIFNFFRDKWQTRQF